MKPTEYRVITVTPDMAAEWLRLNHQPPGSMDHRKVVEFALQMREGTWTWDPSEPIRFWAGTLRNGQHRLNAVVLAGVPVTLPIDNAPKG